MGSLENLLAALDDQVIARKVAIVHDEARMQYAPKKTTVSDFTEFTDIIADYYNYHFSRCVVRGGTMSRREAAGRAKEILEEEYRRQRGNINQAYNDAHDGTNGGLRIVLDRIADRLKAESVERYTRDAFDRYVDPTRWKEKVEIVRQFMIKFNSVLPSHIRREQPERYAQNFEELIRAFVEGLRGTTTIFRKY
jgi:hypothetical protein